MFKRSLRLFYSVQNVCENLRKPYIQIMGMPPSKKDFEVEFCKHLINSPFFEKINKDSFIGYPMFPQLDGYSCGSKLYDILIQIEKNTLSILEMYILVNLVKNILQRCY